MTVGIKLRAFIKHQGYKTVFLDTHEPIYAPIYGNTADITAFEERLLDDKEQLDMLIDFINISTQIDQLEHDDKFGADWIIEEFMGKWGSLTYAEDLHETDQSIRKLWDKDVDGFKPTHLFMTKDQWYSKSKEYREIRTLYEEGNHKLARDKFHEIDRWMQNDMEWDEYWDPIIKPLNGLHALQYIFVISIKNKNPLRVCPVCGNLFQRKITAKQCSDKCKSLKSVRKFRSKK